MAAELLRAVRNPTGLMQAVDRDLQRGRHLFVSGVVPTDRVEVLAGKFAARVPTILADHKERSAAKKLGYPVASLYFVPLKPLGSWEFVLIADRRLEGEAMLDALRSKQRVTVFKGFYRSARKAGGGWTWVMTEKHFDYWQNRLLWAVRTSGSHALPGVIEELLRKVSLFSGVRAQVMQLLGEARAAFRQVGRKGDFPAPKSIPKIRFLEVYLKDVSLAQQVARVRAETEAALVAV